jgi:3-oxoacyl-[acyl-carrier-protein] synthase-3
MPRQPVAVAAAAANGAGRALVRTASIVGLGHALPEQVVGNDEIGARIGVDDAWIQRRTGVRERRHLAPGERVSDLATAASRRALADAGVEPHELDLVLVATMSQDEITPNTAPLVAHGVGAEHAGAYDVGAACTGWVAGLDLAAGLIEARRADRVLLVGAEALSRLTDLDDRKTAALFGDAAGAVVLGADGEGRVGPIRLRADGGIAELIVATHEDPKLRMDGHGTFQVAVTRLTEITRLACDAAGHSLDDIDLFVYHQANARILRSVAERLELPAEKVADYVGGVANTSAASIPLTLALLREDGRLRKGQRVLVAAIGAGFTWGAGIVEWGLA